jgi:3-oxoacyl-[acyl-carrier-protein] synthase-3
MFACRHPEALLCDFKAFEKEYHLMNPAHQGLRRASITGTGMAVPPRVVTNHDLAKLMDTSDEWIRQRSGIVERRHVDPGTGPTELGVEAVQSALKSAGLKSQDIDMMIVATLSPEHYFPGTGSFMQAKLGMGTTPVLEVRNQCSGFLYALNVGQMFIATGQYHRVVVVGVEVHSRALDMTTRGRDVAVLFGDGAGAVVLEPSRSPEHGIMSVHLHAEGQFADKLWVEYPSLGRTPFLSAQVIEEGRVFPQMDGKFVFKNAVRRLPEVVMEGLAAHHLQPADIDHWLFHQANLRINEFVAEQLGIPATRCPSNIQKYGNCSAASVPILLDECVRERRIKPGDLVCMATFGSGFTWASAVIRW